MNIFFEIVASVAECVIITGFIGRYLGFKNEKAHVMKASAFLTLICVNNILLGQTQGFEIISIALLILTTFVYSLIFLKGVVFEKFFISVFPPTMIVIINQLLVSVLCAIAQCPFSEAVNPDGAYRIPVLFFTKFAFFAVCELTVHLKKRNEYPLSYLQWIIQTFCFGATFLAATILWGILNQYPAIRGRCIIVHIMLAAINVLLYIIFNEVRRDAAAKEQLRLSELSLVAQKRFVEEARKHYAEMRMFRHDIRHYLATAAKLISDGNASEAQSYIEELIKEKIEPFGGGMDTGSVVVDAVLNNMVAICHKNGIETKFLIDSRFDGINEMDISVLLSNALDNAVNGCAGADKPRVELVIGTRMAFTYIIVQNSIGASVLANNSMLVTSKRDKALHGFGINSMRRIAEKYDGSIEFKENNGEFITEIWLKNKK